MNGSHYGTYAYVISPQAAAVLLGAIYPAYAQVDSMIIDVAKANAIPVFMSRLPLVSVDNSAERFSRTQRWFTQIQRIPQILYVALSRTGVDTTSHSAWADLYPSWDVKFLSRGSFSRKSQRRSFYASVFSLMWRTGGVYVDGDALEPLRPIDPLLIELDAFVAHDAIGHISRSIFGATSRHSMLRRLTVSVEAASTNALQNSRNVTSSELDASVDSALMDFARAEVSRASHTFRIFATHVFFPNATTGSGAARLAFTFRRDAVSVAFFFKEMVALRLNQHRK